MIRRAAGEAALRKLLGNTPTNVLPFARPVELPPAPGHARSQVESLPAGSDLVFEPTASFLATIRRHWVVVAEPSSDAARLARRYAEVLGRPFLPLDQLVKQTSRAPDGVTIFPPAADNASECYSETIARLELHYGRAVPVGILAAEDLPTLSWLVVKQIEALGLLPGTGTANGHVAYVDEFAHSEPSLEGVVSPRRDEAAEVVRVAAAATTLVMNVHSRPHCGVLFATDGRAGVCASPTRGEGGRCFDGHPCFFADRPRLVLESANASRLLMNGCFTATFGGRPAGLPPETNHAFAAARGRVAEFVGNLRAGRYETQDVSWFLALGSLGYRPAEAVQIVDRTRVAELREAEPSMVYVGDSGNPPWTVVVPAETTVRADGDALEVGLSSSSGIRAARLRGRSWARLAAEGRLDVSTGPAPGETLVSLAEDPFDDYSVLLAVDASPGPRDRPGVQIRLAPRARPAPEQPAVGTTLLETLDRLEFLARTPSLERVAVAASRALVDEVAELRQRLGSPQDLSDRAVARHSAEVREETVAESFDPALVAEACRHAAGYLNWQEEYAPYMSSRPARDPTTCGVCGRTARRFDLVDRVRGKLRRRQVVCVDCAIVEDVPEWDLRVSLVGGSVRAERDCFRCTVEIENAGTAFRRVAAGARVHGFEVDVARSRGAHESLALPVGAAGRIEVDLVAHETYWGFTWMRVYVASRGDFGFVGMPVVFGPAVT